MQRTQTQPRAETVSVLRVVVAKEGGLTSSYEIARELVRFGRSPECDVRLEGKNISRVHCTLEARADGLWVRDNDSLNGIFVNGEKVKEALLTPRDAVKVGPYRFKAIITGQTATRSATAERAAVPASAPALDKTSPAFDARTLDKKPAPATAPAPAKAKDPLPMDEEPIRPTRASSSSGPILEDFVPTLKADSEDQTPADGTPVASPAQALRPPAPAPAPVKVEAKVEAPVAKPSYRDAFQQSARKPEAPKVEAAEAKIVETPRTPAPTNRGRFSLTNGGTRRDKSARPGDLCPSCSVGTLLTWEGALRCRKCDHRADIGSSIVRGAPAPKLEKSEKLEARAPRNAEGKAEKTNVSLPTKGELCPSCYQGRMLTWQGGLRCRTCGNTGELAEPTVVSRSAPAITTAPAPAPVIAKPTPTPIAKIETRPAAPTITPKPEAKIEAKIEAKVEPKIEAKIEAKVEAKTEAKVDVEAKEPATTTVQPGELCSSCFKGHMLTWEGALRCRTCDHRAEIAGGVAKAKPAARPSARPSLTPRPAAARPVATARPAPAVAEPAKAAPAGAVREPNRTAAVITGVGLFIGLYATVGITWVAQMFFVAATMPSF